MAFSAGMRDVGPEDGGLGVDLGPQIMASVAARTGYLTRHRVDAAFEEIARRGAHSQRMFFHKLFIGMAAVAGSSDIGWVDH
jgi:hypothetical protein